MLIWVFIVSFGTQLNFFTVYQLLTSCVSLEQKCKLRQDYEEATKILADLDNGVSLTRLQRGCAQDGNCNKVPLETWEAQLMLQGSSSAVLGRQTPCHNLRHITYSQGQFGVGGGRHKASYNQFAPNGRSPQ